MSIYSIRYPSVDFPYGDCAVDWDWHFKNQWARSGRQGSGSAWISEEGLDEKAYKEVLKHFWLEQWAEEYPTDRIISMSPRGLAQERRKKELEHGLEKLQMTSDTLGYHINAENHGSVERRE